MGRGDGSRQETAPVRRQDDIQGTLKDGKPIYRMLTLDAQNNPVTQLIDLLERGELDLEPPYQRGQVWDEDRKRNLIRSLVMGLPVGSIFINRRNWLDPEVVVDGKQRLLAVSAFLKDEFTVPASWFRPEMVEGAPEQVLFSQLSDPGQLGFKNSTVINVYRTTFDGDDAVDQEKELFDLINFGGVPQGQSDLS